MVEEKFIVGELLLLETANQLHRLPVAFAHRTEPSKPGGYLSRIFQERTLGPVRWAAQGFWPANCEGGVVHLTGLDIVVETEADLIGMPHQRFAARPSLQDGRVASLRRFAIHPVAVVVFF